MIVTNPTLRISVQQHITDQCVLPFVLSNHPKMWLKVHTHIKASTWVPHDCGSVAHPPSTPSHDFLALLCIPICTYANLIYGGRHPSGLYPGTATCTGTNCFPEMSNMFKKTFKTEQKVQMQTYIRYEEKTWHFTLINKKTNNLATTHLL